LDQIAAGFNLVAVGACQENVTNCCKFDARDVTIQVRDLGVVPMRSGKIGPIRSQFGLNKRDVSGYRVISSQHSELSQPPYRLAFVMLERPQLLSGRALAD
jgi:hypothetical protein